MTVEDAAAFLDVSIDHIYRLCSKHRIAYYKPMGKRIYFKRSDLAEWVFSKKILTDEELSLQTDTWLSKNRSGLRMKRQSRNIGK